MSYRQGAGEGEVGLSRPVSRTSKIGKLRQIAEQIGCLARFEAGQVKKGFGRPEENMRSHQDV